MEVNYDWVKGDIKLCFQPHEANLMAFLMEHVWEDRSAHGKVVPAVTVNFFKKFAHTQGIFSYKVKFAYVDFVISFLTELSSSEEWNPNGIEVMNIQNFIKNVGPLCREGFTLHWSFLAMVKRRCRMHALFSKKECLLILILKPKEAKATAILLQMAWLEQIKNSQSVPAYADNFFEELAATTEDVYLKFTFEHLEFAIAFIAKIVQAQKNGSIDSSTLEKLLEHLEPYRTGGFAVN